MPRRAKLSDPAAADAYADRFLPDAADRYNARLEELVDAIARCPSRRARSYARKRARTNVGRFRRTTEIYGDEYPGIRFVWLYHVKTLTEELVAITAMLELKPIPEPAFYRPTRRHPRRLSQPRIRRRPHARPRRSHGSRSRDSGDDPDPAGDGEADSLTRRRPSCGRRSLLSRRRARR